LRIERLLVGEGHLPIGSAKRLIGGGV